MTHHRVPFEQDRTLEDDLRDQIGDLHAERHDLRTAIDLLHRACANLDDDNNRLRAENARLRRQIADHETRRWWWPWS